jgi:hypothetical protein
MTLVVADRAQESSTSTGTGAFTLTGAVTGYQTLTDGVGDGNTTYYAIYALATHEWEVGLGTVTGGTLTRDTVYASSTGTMAIDFPGGDKVVFSTFPAHAINALSTRATDEVAGITMLATAALAAGLTDDTVALTPATFLNALLAAKVTFVDGGDSYVLTDDDNGKVIQMDGGTIDVTGIGDGIRVDVLNIGTTDLTVTNGAQSVTILAAGGATAIGVSNSEVIVIGGGVDGILFKADIVGSDVATPLNVVAYGSNSNGSWARFAGGLQVCWAALDASRSITTAYNVAYTGQQNWGFPAAFLDGSTPVVSGGLDMFGARVWVAPTDSTATTATLCFLDLFTRSNVSSTLKAIAVGNWK